MSLSVQFSMGSHVHVHGADVAVGLQAVFN